ncbi:integrase arm-type DNA-binding domain-containing protein [uncultured Pelagimonas sp.]|uniref:tyrosine-type recombinase/integrase n=1 Tax=uncultured Pelagimonas sp. TaxID=1618102 RepID=UPI002624EAEB|nr:integrase arm-type DNA-binding domain-containing protein [uncultured Pelagimonas sp.]
MGKLTALKLKSVKTGTYQDGDGLMIVRTEKGGRWTFRYSFLGRRRDMGLGSYPTISLSEARKERDHWKAVLAGGNDPIDVRKAAIEAEKTERERVDPTFKELVEIVLEAKKARLRGGGTRGRWMSPFATHMFPKIGSKPASTLTAQDFADSLRPIWKSKYPTAEKAAQRSRLVLREGQLMGFPVDPIVVDQATRMLGEVLHISTPIPATRWQDIPDLFSALPETNAGQCLRLMILSLVRLDGCSGAKLPEFEDGIWTVPADRVKGTEGKVSDFRVPTSRAIEALIADQAQFFDDILFPGTNGTPITSRALEKCLDEMREEGRPHGFRTSFRTWVQDTDACGFEVAEAILNHKVGGKVERSYARSDILERRRPVMEAWARHVTNKGKQ